MKALGVVLLFCGWLAGGTYYYTCVKRGQCESEESISKTQPKPKPVKEVAKPPLFFYPSDGMAHTSKGFKAMHDSISDLVGEGDQLRIVGKYYPDEVNNTKFPNLGVARAEKVKAFFIDRVSDAYILTEGKQLAGKAAGKTLFKAADFSVVVAPKAVEEPKALIRESERKATILFPYNSTNPILPTEVQAYLDEVGGKLKETGQKVKVTGHTDDRGDEAANKALGLKRAKIVQGLLAKRGVKASQITSTSMGEKKPKATNDTEIGRKTNRRVEIEILTN